jgi:hypothetical protein
MPSKPNVLTVAEFLKLKGTQKRPVIVYFNGDQWANLTRNVRPGKGKPPGKTMTLTLMELPGLSGGLATFGCPIECSGPIRGGEGEVRCNCGGDLPTPGSPGGATIEACFMRVRRDGSVSCAGVCRSGRTCRLASWIVPSPSGARLVLSSCNCSR